MIRALILAWLASGAATLVLLWPALAAARREDDEAAGRDSVPLIRSLRPPRLADVTDAADAPRWDAIAAGEPWRGILQSKRYDTPNRKAA